MNRTQGRWGFFILAYWIAPIDSGSLFVIALQFAGLAVGSWLLADFLADLSEARRT